VIGSELQPRSGSNIPVWRFANQNNVGSRYNLKRRVASLPPISSEVFTDKVLQARAVSTAEADKAYFERSCDVCDKTYYSENAYQNHLLSQKHKINEGTLPSHPIDETTSVISSTFSLGEPTPAPRRRLDSDVEAGVHNLAIADEEPKKSESSNAQTSTASTSAEAEGASIARDSESATPVQTSAEEPAWTLQSCIFCNYDSPTIALNITHMERIHGMFIPERNYVADLDGLVKFLQRKVREYHECLFCGKFKSGTFAIQTHMRDTGHCKIPYTTEDEQLEIGDFYDFRSTYSDPGASDDEEDTAEDGQGGAKLGRRAREPKERGEGAGAGEDDGWETDSSASSLDSDDLTAVPAESHLHQFDRLSKHPHHSRHDPRHRHQADGWHSHAHKHTHAVFYDDYEMHLPSGRAVGHRSLNKYYRQNLTNYPSAEERAERMAIEGASDEEDEDNRQVATRGRRGREVVPRGVAGIAGVSEQKKQAVRRAEQHGRTLENDTAKRKDYAYGKKLNNFKNYYYRYQGGG
jgi:pre-60S factor REI1